MDTNLIKFVQYKFTEDTDLTIFDRWLDADEMLGFLLGVGKPFMIDRSYSFSIFIAPARSQIGTRIHFAINAEETAKKILLENYPQVYNGILSPNSEYYEVFGEMSFVDIVVQVFGIIYVDYFGIKTRFDIGDTQKLILSILDINGYFDRTHLSLTNIQYIQDYDEFLFKKSDDCCRFELEIKNSEKHIWRYMYKPTLIFPPFKKAIDEYIYRASLNGCQIINPYAKYWYVNASLQPICYFDRMTETYVECNME